MIGKRLNHLRKSRGITAQQMADYLQIGINAYRKYESNQRQPSLEGIVKIADKLQVTTDYLLNRSEFMTHGEVPAGEC